MTSGPDESRPMPCCVLLRGKTMAFNPAERPGRLCYSDEQTYWCSITQSPAGPDDQAANPPACQPGRACYRETE